jgi:CheY-like chemotaxis protein
MGGGELERLSILVVEDEPVIAVEAACAIGGAGGTVVGPAYSLDQAFKAIAGTKIDGALLDINLRNQKVFTLADTLAERGVPLVFVTGEIWPVIPPRHAGRRIVGKPAHPSKLVAALRGAIADGPDLAIAS